MARQSTADERRPACRNESHSVCAPGRVAARGPTFAFLHRALAARRAMAVRSSGESIALRFLPPSRPKNCAASRIMAFVRRLAMAARYRTGLRGGKHKGLDKEPCLGVCIDH
jgi:hypothetical protein